MYGINMLKVRKILKGLWPNLRHIWPWDRQYSLVTPEVLRGMSDVVRQAKIVFPDGTEIVFGDLQNMGDFWDCDDFACGGEFLTKLWHKIGVEKAVGEKVPIAYGQARGSQFRSLAGLHALNICIVVESDGTKGVYFNDHDDGGRIWKADSDGDVLFYVSV